MNSINQYHDQLYQNIFNIKSRIKFSFEFFPPINYSDPQGKFLSSIKKLSIFNPNFISITCTSKNNIEDYTYQSIQKIPKKLNLNIAPHMICANFSKKYIRDLAKRYWDDGIKSIVALRGDSLHNKNSLKFYASDLVYLLKQVADFDISVAAYPEKHPESKNIKDDINNLKMKINCGANRAITQFFFDVDKYLKFRDNCLKVGISVDIIPGILPIVNFQQLKKFVSMTNVHIPKWIHNIFQNVSHEDIYINKMVGLLICVNIIQKLCSEGVSSFHFYTLNHFDTIYTLCTLLQQNSSFE
ncbi:methylenetetrahydrofolate reductase [Buchnera aphidicola]|uniref:methylenetetrahydrofolate reductase n=1 Tax=Buchnera aphidicola TaxID=9 RepID=UPI003463EA58